MKRHEYGPFRIAKLIQQSSRWQFVDPHRTFLHLVGPDHLPQEQPYVGGHVPGAKNIPWSKAANDDGTFKSAEELSALYGGEGVGNGDTEVIAYCRIGERSSHTWFVLRELLGNQAAKNYDGSWTEYGSMVNVPVERD